MANVNLIQNRAAGNDNLTNKFCVLWSSNWACSAYAMCTVLPPWDDSSWVTSRPKWRANRRPPLSSANKCNTEGQHLIANRVDQQSCLILVLSDTQTEEGAQEKEEAAVAAIMGNNHWLQLLAACSPKTNPLNTIPNAYTWSIRLGCAISSLEQPHICSALPPVTWDCVYFLALALLSHPSSILIMTSRARWPEHHHKDSRTCQALLQSRAVGTYVSWDVDVLRKDSNWDRGETNVTMVPGGQAR